MVWYGMRKVGKDSTMHDARGILVAKQLHERKYNILVRSIRERRGGEKRLLTWEPREEIIESRDWGR